ncbi:MAG: hypothetical protein HDT20_05405 [Oscillibacter sp.]|nr:hypothetical protein [Oscillibacter sp.]
MDTILQIYKKERKSEMKIGESIYTPRFCTVKVTAIFAEEAEARRCGYTEPTYYEGEYIILGRSLDQYHMDFAAIPK